MDNNNKQMVLTDGSRLMIEAMARAGADAFIGYPITPANLLYSYAASRMDMMMPAPDEITTLQWMTGLAATGKVPVTATSFPGFALMIESVNMAFMMELPMVIVLVQRLGPATGTATSGAQGDLLMLKGMISGGHQLPVLCTSDFEDAWSLAAKAVHVAVELRTPVVLLTTKEEVMTYKSFDYSKLDAIKAVEKKLYRSEEPYQTYAANENLVPDFLPVTQNKHQVRINASTHDKKGVLQHSNVESMENTKRLEYKALKNIDSYLHFEYDKGSETNTLIVSFGITAAAAKEAVEILRANGKNVSLLIPKTLLPLPGIYMEIISKYNNVILAEENLNGQFADLLFGYNRPENLHFIGAIGKMISPDDILKVEDNI